MKGGIFLVIFRRILDSDVIRIVDIGYQVEYKPAWFVNLSLCCVFAFFRILFLQPGLVISVNSERFSQSVFQFVNPTRSLSLGISTVVRSLTEQCSMWVFNVFSERYLYGQYGQK